MKALLVGRASELLEARAQIKSFILDIAIVQYYHDLINNIFWKRQGAMNDSIIVLTRTPEPPAVYFILAP